MQRQCLLRLQWGRVLTDTEISRSGRAIPGRALLQWGRVLTDTEIRLSWWLRVRQSKLQWGRVLTDTEIIRAGSRDSIGVSASMGPRPYGHGNLPAGSGSLEIYRLQWGRVLTDTEMYLGVFRGCCPGRASMGPRPYGHGNHRGRGVHARHSVGFNGAASLRTRKYLSPGQSLRRGDALQWGRVLTDTEIAVDGPGLVDKAQASMGPRPYGHGNKSPADARPPPLTSLQWGRVLTDTEMAP
jgi:hypothetical protein